MGKILIHHPWVHFYLLLVGTLLIAVLVDRLRHPPPPRRKYRPPEASSTSPPVCAKPAPPLRSWEVAHPTASHKKQLGQCQDRHSGRIRE
jgi:hypothetical protein